MNPLYSDAPALAAAIRFLQQLILGSVASTVAIIAVAVIGLLMMAGRIAARRAVEVIFGCFIIFGASSIASGIMASLSVSEPPVDVVPPPAPAEVRLAPPTPPVAAQSDPYAGASVPTR